MFQGDKTTTINARTGLNKIFSTGTSLSASYNSKLYEKIDVVTSFVGGKINIIRFRWKNTVLKVDKITGKWLKKFFMKNLPFLFL